MKGKRVTTTKGVNEDLSELRWLEEDLVIWTTHIYEMEIITPTLDVYHDDSDKICGGLALLGPNTVLYDMQ